MPKGKVVLVFPGQGSQKVGAGQDVFKTYDSVRKILAAADRITGRNISKLCFEGPIEELTLTKNVQPAITAVSLAFLKILKVNGINPNIVLGHSLGEISAFHATEMISDEEALEIATIRGALMQREAEKHPGKMYAIVGLNFSQVNNIIERVNSQKTGVISLANYNTEFQVVISGEETPLKTAANLCREQGAKLIKELAVSGAWHSPLMKDAEEELHQFLIGLDFGKPSANLLLNRTADYEDSIWKIKIYLSQQLTNTVRWYESIIRLNQQKDIAYYMEVGSGEVLTGLLKKILPKEEWAKIFSINSLVNLQKFLDVYN